MPKESTVKFEEENCGNRTVEKYMNPKRNKEDEVDFETESRLSEAVAYTGS